MGMFGVFSTHSVSCGVETRPGIPHQRFKGWQARQIVCRVARKGSNRGCVGRAKMLDPMFCSRCMVVLRILRIHAGVVVGVVAVWISLLFG